MSLSLTFSSLNSIVSRYYIEGVQLSGGISYAMKLSGPSTVTDSHLFLHTDMYQAYQALANGDYSTALAGGVNVICSPNVINFKSLIPHHDDSRNNDLFIVQDNHSYIKFLFPLFNLHPRFRVDLKNHMTLS